MGHQAKEDRNERSLSTTSTLKIIWANTDLNQYEIRLRHVGTAVPVHLDKPELRCGEVSR